MNRTEFMEAYRHDEELNQSLTADDCVEIFIGILKGSSDVNYKNRKSLEAEYDLPDNERDFVIRPYVRGTKEHPCNYKESEEV